MNHLKHFLDRVCENSEEEYLFEQVDNLAEIYEIDSDEPIAIVEHNTSREVYEISFRIGVSSRQIAKLTRDMAVEDMCISFNEDFIIDPEYGYLYGEEATQHFMYKIQSMQSNEDTAMEGAIYMSPEPIFTQGTGHMAKSKLEKWWGDDMFDEGEF